MWTLRGDWTSLTPPNTPRPSLDLVDTNMTLSCWGGWQPSHRSSLALECRWEQSTLICDQIWAARPWGWTRIATVLINLSILWECTVLSKGDRRSWALMCWIYQRFYVHHYPSDTGYFTIQYSLVTALINTSFRVYAYLDALLVQLYNFSSIVRKLYRWMHKLLIKRIWRNYSVLCTLHKFQIKPQKLKPIILNDTGEFRHHKI